MIRVKVLPICILLCLVFIITLRIDWPDHEQNTRLMLLKKCDSGTLKFLIIVHSDADNFLQRQLVRVTWAQHWLKEGMSMEVLFVTGLPQNISMQPKLEMENSIYRDMFQVQSTDNYYNNWKMTAATLKWLKTQNCQIFSYVLITEDINCVNVFTLYQNILKRTTGVGNKSDIFSCFGPKELKDKSADLKTHQLYKLYNVFPSACSESSATFLLSQDIAKNLENTLSPEKSFRLDNDHVMRMMMEKHNTRLTASTEFFYLNEENIFYLLGSDRRQFLLARMTDSYKFIAVWKRLQTNALRILQVQRMPSSTVYPDIIKTNPVEVVKDRSPIEKNMVYETFYSETNEG